ncbi:TIGR03826 family flagellar region protein [Cohnella nanjingensis]|uniref:Flagellar protein n=1 Tax=Cohnella nanjingensis TaxID=1387779 RepID=A0A7X0RQ53_9BACL|nr:TIGR03826 family flagellar region protein [Cohnella nanjingensis]MBB6671525.1 flagellar protein [Cohnella nanjingensis]
MDLANCPRCGKLFARHFRDICPNCHGQLEKEYEDCVQFLRDNKGATIQVLSEETGVSIKQITRFIREGRISLYNAPNLSYPCEVCGMLIRDGNMCENCRGRLQRDVRQATSSDRPTSASQEYRNGGSAYRIGDRLRDRN